MGKSLRILILVRESWVSKVFTFIMALYLLNISVDVLDARTSQSDENLSINEIESFAELMIEEIGQCDDFFDEQHEAEREPFTKLTTSLVFILPPQLTAPCRAEGMLMIANVPSSHPYYQTYLNKISPPPKTV